MSIDVNFDQNNTGEDILLEFGVGRGRKPTTKLYAKGCSLNQHEKDEIDTSDPEVITKTVNIMGRATSTSGPAMDIWHVGYTFNKSKISNSSFWNVASKSIELCQAVQLLYANMTIVEKLTNLTVDFNMFANVTLGAALENALVNSADDTAKLNGYVDAYHCDGSDEMKDLEQDAKLKPNNYLSTCYKSISADVELNEISSMVRVHSLY